jgi:hypothetical protein
MEKAHQNLAGQAQSGVQVRRWNDISVQSLRVNVGQVCDPRSKGGRGPEVLLSFLTRNQARNYDAAGAGRQKLALSNEV